MKRIIKYIVIAILIIALIIFLGIQSTKSLKVKEYNIINDTLPDSFNGFKVVHFGDVLYGSSVNKKFLNKIVKEINKLKPDMIVFTGDLFSKEAKLTSENKKEIQDALKKLTPKFKYAIYGDNDNKELEDILKKCNFKILKDDYTELYYKGSTPIIISNTDSDKDLFTIRLIHKPDDIDSINKENVDVILAGHSLNGQIRLPFVGALIKKSGAKKYTDDYYKYDEYEIFITSGLGTYSPNIRILNKPSINLYRLTNY